MYPEIMRFIDIASIGLIVICMLAFGQLVLAWWRSRQDS